MPKHKHLKDLFELGEQIRNNTFKTIWDLPLITPQLPKSAIEEPEPHEDDERIQ